MLRPTFTLLVAGILLAGSARAQADNAVAQPSSPAPAVVSTDQPSNASVVQAPNANPAAGVTQIVYAPKLPTAAELSNAAAAQGLTVERIVQTANQVIAFYRTPNGQTMNVAYQSLPPTTSSASAAAPAPTTAAAPAVVVTSPSPTVVAAPPTVVYETAPRVIYYDYPAYYYPRYWYPPVSFNFGFGYSHVHRYGGGYRHR